MSPRRAIVLGTAIAAAVIVVVMVAQPSTEAPEADPTSQTDATADVHRLEASTTRESATSDALLRAPVATDGETPTTILTGTVLGPDGDAAPDCHVIVMVQPMSDSFELRTEPPVPPWTGTTDEAGEFVFELDLSEAEEWRGSLYAASSQIAFASHPLALECGRRYELRPIQLPRTKTREEIPPIVQALMIWSATLSGK